MQISEGPGPGLGQPERRFQAALRLMHYIRGAAGIALFIAALKFVEILIAPPPIGAAPRWLVAAVLTFKFWAAGAFLAALAALGWASHRLFGWPPPSALIPTRHVVATEVMRLRVLGVNMVLGWIGLSVLSLIVMADTGTGPFAWIAAGLFGPNMFLGFETFVLGAAVFAAPLVVLAWLPWQTRFPLLYSMQNVIKPPPKPRARRRKRP